jgi:DNA-directed RNA polymerase subunit alpha
MTEKIKADVLSEPLKVLKLPQRILDILFCNLGLRNVGELIQKSESELLLIRNFGSKSLKIVKKRLAKIGQELRP